jgi:hypothetical protein
LGSTLNTKYNATHYTKNSTKLNTKNPSTDQKKVYLLLVNEMLEFSGYPWTVIPVKTRNEYLAALEKASESRDL